MQSRVEDLMSTAEKQLAGQSYAAAIDTYRTALSEMSGDDADAVRAGIQARLDQLLPREPIPVEPPAPPPVETLERPRQSVPDEVLLKPPAPLPVMPEQAPIEPPAFHLIEDDPSMLERPRREEYADEPPLSILDPTPRAEEPERTGFAALPLALIGLFAAVLVGSIHNNRETRPLPSPPPVDQAYTVATAGVIAPVLIHDERPEYTEDARLAAIEGTVVLYVEVGRDGTPTVLGVLQRLDPGLDERAQEAVRQWRYQPGTKDGAPVKILSNVAVNFRLP